jgi:hypothetical protein
MGVRIFGETTRAGARLNADLAVKASEWAWNSELIRGIRNIFAKPVTVVQTLVTVAAALAHLSAKDPITWFYICNFRTAFINDPGNLVTCHAGAVVSAVLSGKGVNVTVADSACHDRKLNLFDNDIQSHFGYKRRFTSHKSFPLSFLIDIAQLPGLPICESQLFNSKYRPHLQGNMDGLIVAASGVITHCDIVC